jgi:hypothetical protein
MALHGHRKLLGKKAKDSRQTTNGYTDFKPLIWTINNFI